MDKSQKLQCLKEAVASHGNTSETEKWYKKWMPEYYEEYGLPTTVQYSLSCSLMKHAFELCFGDIDDKLKTAEKQNFSIDL